MTTTTATLSEAEMKYLHLIQMERPAAIDNDSKAKFEAMGLTKGGLLTKAGHRFLDIAALDQYIMKTDTVLKKIK
jgi:hypothetical protein